MHGLQRGASPPNRNCTSSSNSSTAVHIHLCITALIVPELQGKNSGLSRQQQAAAAPRSNQHPTCECPGKQQL
jgi:hypothetical protein